MALSSVVKVVVAICVMKKIVMMMRVGIVAMAQTCAVMEFMGDEVGGEVVVAVVRLITTSVVILRVKMPWTDMMMVVVRVTATWGVTRGESPCDALWTNYAEGYLSRQG